MFTGPVPNKIENPVTGVLETLSSRLAHATALRTRLFATPMLLLGHRVPPLGFDYVSKCSRVDLERRYAMPWPAQGRRAAGRVPPQALFHDFLRFRLQAIQIRVAIYSRLSNVNAPRRHGAPTFASIARTCAKRARL